MRLWTSADQFTCFRFMPARNKVLTLWAYFISFYFFPLVPLEYSLIYLMQTIIIQFYSPYVSHYCSTDDLWCKLYYSALCVSVIYQVLHEKFLQSCFYSSLNCTTGLCTRKDIHVGDMFCQGVGTDQAQYFCFVLSLEREREWFFLCVLPC